MTDPQSRDKQILDLIAKVMGKFDVATLTSGLVTASIRLGESDRERIVEAVTLIRTVEKILAERQPTAASFTCRICGLTSHHPKDAEHRYCSLCDVFHPVGEA